MIGGSAAKLCDDNTDGALHLCAPELDFAPVGRRGDDDGVGNCRMCDSAWLELFSSVLKTFTVVGLSTVLVSSPVVALCMGVPMIVMGFGDPGFQIGVHEKSLLLSCTIWCALAFPFAVFQILCECSWLGVLAAMLAVAGSCLCYQLELKEFVDDEVSSAKLRFRFAMLCVCVLNLASMSTSFGRTTIDQFTSAFCGGKFGWNGQDASCVTGAMCANGFWAGHFAVSTCAQSALIRLRAGTTM